MTDLTGIDSLNGLAVSDETAMQMAAEAMGDGVGGGGDIKMHGSDEIENTTTPEPPCCPAPPVDIKLFVGRVPQHMDENLLKPIFEEFGEVKETVIIRDKATGKHKSSAFVKMASLCQADNAIRLLNNIRVLEPNMGAMQVKYATGEADRLGLSPAASEPGIDQAKLFVGSLPKNVDDESVLNLFQIYGHVEEVFLMKDGTTGCGKGCGFVKLEYKEQALHAIKNLNAKHTFEGCTRPMEVRFAESRSARMNTQGPMGGGPAQCNRMGGPGGMNPNVYPNTVFSGGSGPIVPNNSQPRCAGQWKEYFTAENRPYYHSELQNLTQWDRPPEFDNPTNGDVHGPPGANLFIFHVPNEWSARDLNSAFQVFGPMASSRIATDKHTGRNRGYAFVSYHDVETAANAVTHMNGFMALNKRLKVTIKKGEEAAVQQHLMNSQHANNNPPTHFPNAGNNNNAAPQQQQWAPYVAVGGGGGYPPGTQRFTPY